MDPANRRRIASAESRSRALDDFGVSHFKNPPYTDDAFICNLWNVWYPPELGRLVVQLRITHHGGRPYPTLDLLSGVSDVQTHSSLIYVHTMKAGEIKSAGKPWMDITRQRNWELSRSFRGVFKFMIFMLSFRPFCRLSLCRFLLSQTWLSNA